MIRINGPSDLTGDLRLGNINKLTIIILITPRVGRLDRVSARILLPLSFDGVSHVFCRAAKPVRFPAA
jgi:hypothetical protein